MTKMITPATTNISSHYRPAIDGVLSRWHATIERDNATGKYLATQILGSVAEGSEWFATQTRAEDHLYALGYTDSVPAIAAQEMS